MYLFHKIHFATIELHSSPEKWTVLCASLKTINFVFVQCFSPAEIVPYRKLLFACDDKIKKWIIVWNPFLDSVVIVVLMIVVVECENSHPATIYHQTQLRPYNRSDINFKVSQEAFNLPIVGNLMPNIKGDGMLIVCCKRCDLRRETPSHLSSRKRKTALANINLDPALLLLVWQWWCKYIIQQFTALFGENLTPIPSLF